MILNRRTFLGSMLGGAAALVVPAKSIFVFGTGVRPVLPWAERVAVGGKIYVRGKDGLMVIDADMMSERWAVMKEQRPKILRDIEAQNRILREAYAEVHGKDGLALAFRNMGRGMLPGVSSEPRGWFRL